MRPDTTLGLIDWKDLNDREVIVAIYPMVIGIFGLMKMRPRIAIGKANVSHQKKLLDNRKQNSEHPKTRSR